MVYLRRTDEPLRDGPQAVSEMSWHDGWHRRGMGHRADGGGEGTGARGGGASGASAADTVRGAGDALGGIKTILSRGDVVVLKPNIGWDRTPEQAANTDPDVVVALAELCLSAGAKEVRVFDRTCNEPRRCYGNSGSR